MTITYHTRKRLSIMLMPLDRYLLKPDPKDGLPASWGD
jgi:hypothetical protein